MGDIGQAVALGAAAYNAYGEFVAWKAHDGTLLPSWDDLALRVQMAWCAAADAVREAIEGPDSQGPR